MTVNDLIIAALRRLRVISGSDPADGDSINDALLRFNDWIDDLANNDFLIQSRLRTLWTISSGVGTYTVGNGATINVETPISPDDIENIGYVDNSIAPSYERLIGPCLSEDAYASIPQKTQTSSYPYYAYYNPPPPGTANGSLRLWPVPTSASLQGVLYTGVSLQEVTINQTLTLAPGWRRFLRDGLALELAAEFHVDDQAVLSSIQRGYDEAQRNIKRKNKRLRDLQPSDTILMFASNGPGNIYTGP